MRNPRPGPTLSTDVSPSPVSGLGLLRGARTMYLSYRAADGKWSPFSAVLVPKSWKQKQEQLPQPWCVLA